MNTQIIEYDHNELRREQRVRRNEVPQDEISLISRITDGSVVLKDFTRTETLALGVFIDDMIETLRKEPVYVSADKDTRRMAEFVLRTHLFETYKDLIKTKKEHPSSLSKYGDHIAQQYHQLQHSNEHALDYIREMI